jgi:hypothetical protein
MIILDTDTATHFSYGNENIRKRIESVGHDEQVAVTIITWIEMLRGRAEACSRQLTKRNSKRRWSVFAEQKRCWQSF